MSQQGSTGEAEHLTIFYEVIAENVDEVDPAEMQAVANTVVKALRQDGYTVTPVPTGTRGGEFLYQITPFLQASAQFALTHKDEIIQAVKIIAPIIERITTWHKQRQPSETRGGVECELRLGEDFDSLKFTSTDTEGTEQFRYTLERFLENSQHTRAKEKTNTPIVDGTLTIQEHVPARPRRRRR